MHINLFKKWGCGFLVKEIVGARVAQELLLTMDSPE